jgi:hypothetical protein
MHYTSDPFDWFIWLMLALAAFAFIYCGLTHKMEDEQTDERGHSDFKANGR